MKGFPGSLSHIISQDLFSFSAKQAWWTTIPQVFLPASIMSVYQKLSPVYPR